MSSSPFTAAELRRSIEGSGAMLPARAYTDPAVLAWECEHFFERAWVCAGRAAPLAETGDRTAVRVGAESVLLVRADDGLRAYSNVCRHRGHELVPCGTSERRAAIHCPYHAWTYTLEGALVATPRYARPPGFDAAALGLVPVRAQEWRGWVMVDVGGRAGELAEHVGELDELLASYAPERLVTAATERYEVAANWKLLVENYHECLHCSLIHPELSAVSPPDSGDNFAPECPGDWIGGRMDLADGAESMTLDGAPVAAAFAELSARQRRGVLYVGLFPNLLISAHPDYVLTHRLEPRAPDRTLVECQWLLAPGTDPAPAVEFWDRTNRQDWSACESVQRGARARGYRPGPFGLQEDAVAAWVARVARAYRDG